MVRFCKVSKFILCACDQQAHFRFYVLLHVSKFKFYVFLKAHLNNLAMYCLSDSCCRLNAVLSTSMGRLDDHIQHHLGLVALTELLLTVNMLDKHKE